MNPQVLQKTENTFAWEGMSSLYFCLFCIALIFGVFFYDWGYWDFIDEIMTAAFGVTVLFATKRQERLKRKLIWLYFSIILFYVVYSALIRSNVIFAIGLDALTISKGFIAFIFANSLNLTFSDSQKQFLQRLVLCLALFMLLYWGYMPKTDATIAGTLFPGSRLGGIAILLACLYYAVSPATRTHLVIAVLICALGWLRPTSKFICFFPAIFLFWFFLKDPKRASRPSLGIIVLLTIGIGTYLVWDDIDFFFIEGTEREFARPVLYKTGYEILWDYFPFGSGFASFGTSTSANYYSHLYGQYGIDIVYGIGPDNPVFISDTFYPALAEQGIVGVILWFSFFIWIFYKALSAFKKIPQYYPLFVCLVLLIIHLLIESVSDSTFISNRGFFAMFLMGILLNQLQREGKTQDITLTEEVYHA